MVIQDLNISFYMEKFSSFSAPQLSAIAPLLLVGLATALIWLWIFYEAQLSYFRLHYTAELPGIIHINKKVSKSKFVTF